MLGIILFYILLVVALAVSSLIIFIVLDQRLHCFNAAVIQLIVTTVQMLVLTAMQVSSCMQCTKHFLYLQVIGLYLLDLELLVF